MPYLMIHACENLPSSKSEVAIAFRRIENHSEEKQEVENGEQYKEDNVWIGIKTKDRRGKTTDMSLVCKCISWLLCCLAFFKIMIHQNLYAYTCLEIN